MLNLKLNNFKPFKYVLIFMEWIEFKLVCKLKSDITIVKQNKITK